MLPTSLRWFHVSLPLTLRDVYMLHVPFTTISISLPDDISTRACRVSRTEPTSTVPNALPVALCSSMQFVLLSVHDRLQKQDWNISQEIFHI